VGYEPTISTGERSQTYALDRAASGTDIIDFIEKKKLQWYGHVKRMPEERIPELIMELIPREKRKRGRPRETWMEGVQAAMTARNLEQDQ
jgi:hypothetical protein